MEAIRGGVPPAPIRGPGPGSARLIALLARRLHSLEKDVKEIAGTEVDNQSELYVSELISSLIDLDNKLEIMCKQDVTPYEEEEVRDLLKRLREIKRRLVMIKEKIIKHRV